MRPFLDLNSQPIRNIVHNPAPSSALTGWTVSNRGTGAGSLSYDSTESAFVDTVTTNYTGFTFRIGGAASSYLPVIPGWWIQQSIWVKSSRTDGRAFIFDAFKADGTTASSHTGVGLASGWDGGTRISLPANTWTQLYYQEKLGTDAAFISACVTWVGNAGAQAAVNRQVGDTTKFRNAVVLMTPTQPPANRARTYVDRNTPGWTGVGPLTTRGSYAVGYPVFGT